jgi:hypothetical protein
VLVRLTLSAAGTAGEGDEQIPGKRHGDLMLFARIDILGKPRKLMRNIFGFELTDLFALHHSQDFAPVSQMMAAYYLWPEETQ